MTSGLVIRDVRALVVLSGPIVFTQLGQIANGFVDVMMVGRLGPAQLAGVSLGNATYFLFMLICIGTLMAVGPMVSQAYGAGDHEPIGRSVRQGLWLGVALAVPVVIVFWNVAPIWRVLAQDPAIIDLASEYMRAVLWGFLPFMWFSALRNFVEAISKPWPVTVIIASGVLLNIAADYALMFGKLGMPAMGLAGTGWATALVNWFMLAAIVVYVQTNRKLRRFRTFARLGHPDCGYFKELVRIGAPIGASYGLEVTLFAGSAFLIGTIGPDPLAAHQIAIQCAAITFMVPLGIGIGTSVRVGQSIGRGDPSGATLAGYTGMGLALCCMLGTALLFWLIPETIVGIYLSSDVRANVETVRIAVGLLGIAAVFQLFDGLQVTALNALRGLKDTRTPMLLCLIAYWVVGVPTGVGLGFGLDLGAHGFWWGLVIGLLAASLMLSLRFVLITRRLRTNPHLFQYS